MPIPLEALDGDSVRSSMAEPKIPSRDPACGTRTPTHKSDTIPRTIPYEEKIPRKRDEVSIFES